MPAYHKLIGEGSLNPGCTIDNSVAIFFEDNEAKNIISSRKGSAACYVESINGKIIEKTLKPDVLL